MKLTRSEFQNYVHSYETDEIFYRDLYFAEKDHPETFMEYCKSDCRRVKKYAAEVSVRTEAKRKESLQGWKTVIQRTEKPGFWFIQY